MTQTNAPSFGERKEITMETEINGIVLGGKFYELFPDLTWDDEPQECEIIIKRKKI
ncbi:MAG: hypothetical protein ACI31E_06045 [Muribaculaceae bacterium]